VLELQRLVHEEKIIGEPYRMFCDFGLELHLEDKPPVCARDFDLILHSRI